MATSATFLCSHLPWGVAPSQFVNRRGSYLGVQTNYFPKISPFVLRAASSNGASRSSSKRNPRKEPGKKKGPVSKQDDDSVEEDLEETIVLDSADAVLKKLARDMGIDESEMDRDATEEEMLELEEHLNKVVEEEKKSGKWLAGDTNSDLDQEFSALLDDLDSDDESDSALELFPDTDDEEGGSSFYGLRSLEEDKIVVEIPDMKLDASDEEIQLALDTLNQIFRSMKDACREGAEEEVAELADVLLWNAKRLAAIEKTIDCVGYFIDQDTDEEAGFDVNEDDLVLTASTVRRIRGTSAGMDEDEAGSGKIILNMVGVTVEQLNNAETVLEQIILAGNEEEEEEVSTVDGNQGENEIDVEAVERQETEEEEWDPSMEVTGVPGVALERSIGSDFEIVGDDFSGLSSEDVRIASATFEKLRKKVKSGVSAASELAKRFSWDKNSVRAVETTAGMLKQMDDMNRQFDGGNPGADLEEDGDEIEIDGDDLELALALLDELLEAMEEEEKRGKKGGGKGKKMKGLGLEYEELELAATVLRQMLEEGEEVEEEYLDDDEEDSDDEEEEESVLPEESLPEDVELAVATVTETVQEEVAVKSSKELTLRELIEVPKTALAQVPVSPEVGIEEAGEIGEAPRVVQLAKWQLRKLAAALKKGKRHINVKALAGETHLDRRDVLAFLSNPPPGLEDLDLEPQFQREEGSDSAKDLQVKGAVVVEEIEPKEEEGPWNPSIQKKRQEKKKLSRENEDTLERVFKKTQYPTGSMVSSLTELTRLPRRRILEWFGERRVSAGKPSSGDAGLPAIEPSTSPKS